MLFHTLLTLADITLLAVGIVDAFHAIPVANEPFLAIRRRRLAVGIRLASRCSALVVDASAAVAIGVGVALDALVLAAAHAVGTIAVATALDALPVDAKAAAAIGVALTTDAGMRLRVALLTPIAAKRYRFGNTVDTHS